MEEKPNIPLSNIVAGTTLYWVCIVACLLCMIGCGIVMLSAENNLADPYKIFALVWEGKNPAEVWKISGQEGRFPGAHFWVRHLDKGDGIVQLGIWIGCCCALPAVFFSGLVFLFRGPRIYFVISMWVSFMILYAMLGQ